MTIDNSTLTIIDTDLEHSQFSIKSKTDVNLRKVKILGTGGTILSKLQNSSQTAGYSVDLSIDELISSIPDISSSVELQYEQVMNIDSKEMNQQYLLTLYTAVIEAIANGIDGIVITHGTDTMEETAFFLQMCIDTEIPIVISGSMRPSTAISLDGPMNLYQAICIAASKTSRGRGVLVSLNDQVSSGFYITKANANTLDSFNGRQGYLGNFVNNEIHYYYPPVKPVGLNYFQLDISKQWDEVVIVYLHQGLNDKIFEILVESLGARGIVIATMGAGSLSDSTIKELARIWSRYQIPIVYSKRSMDGMVPKLNIPREGAIAAGYLNPPKLRVLLQLCLQSGMEFDQIKSCFASVYGG